MATTTASSNATASQQQQLLDLTPMMAPFLDIHMVGPLLDFLREAEVYDAKVVTNQKIALMLRTNLIDLVEEEFARYPNDEAMQLQLKKQEQELQNRRVQLFDLIDHEPAVVTRVHDFFLRQQQQQQQESNNNDDNNKASNSSSGSNLTLEGLLQQQITVADLEAYVKFAKFKYECGMYTDAELMLTHFLSVTNLHNSNNNSVSLTTVLGARWGRLACRILGAKWDLATQDLIIIKDIIDKASPHSNNSNNSISISATDLLKQRAWLLHWALFVNINQRDGVSMLVDLFAERVYLQTMENLCPWLLRYYAAFVVLSSRAMTMMREVVNELQSLSYLYSDPMTLLLLALFVDFDFEEAQRQLVACQQLMKNDFFLQIYGDKFLVEARILLLQVYCTIHCKVDINTLATQLQMTVDEVEKWLVELVVNNAGKIALEVKIDSAAKMVYVSPPNHQQQQYQQQFIDRTRDLTNRSVAVANSLTTLAHEQAGYIQAHLSS